jgi:arylsulfatase A-like enzyme
VDAAGGMVLDALDELGLADDTLVMWTADHGDPIASHAGHFGKESFLREEVLRIPFAMRWPNVIKRAQKSERLISNMDPPVTLFSAAGTSFDGPVDGRDLLQLFCGGILKEDVSWPDDLMCETHGHHWKEVEGRSLITKDYLYSAYRFREIPSYIRETDDLNNMDELYDLKSDPFQLSNLARERSFRGTIDEMRKRLRRWMERTGDDAAFL